MKRRRIPEVGKWVGLLLILALLIAHTFQWNKLKIDNVTLALVGALFVLPLLESLKKIRLGEFEAEIAQQEVSAAVAKASSDLPALPPEDAPSKSSPIMDLVRKDPQMGLAKLRIDMEQALKAQDRIGDVSAAPKGRGAPLSKIVKALEHSGDLSSDVAASLRDVLSIANRAVHGESVTTESAEMLSLLGIQILDELWDIYKRKVAEPLQSLIIDSSYLDRLRSSKYRVVTASPLVRNPTIALRVLDQSGLDEFLEGYDEFAEFLVSIEPIDVTILESLR